MYNQDYSEDRPPLWVALIIAGVIWFVVPVAVAFVVLFL